MVPIPDVIDTDRICLLPRVHVFGSRRVLGGKCHANLDDSHSASPSTCSPDPLSTQSVLRSLDCWHQSRGFPDPEPRKSFPHSTKLFNGSTGLRRACDRGMRPL